MGANSFKDLIVWQKSAELTVSIYDEFKNLKDFGFKDQIQRASVSIMNNIAEGYAKRSDKSFKNFLSIAKGSCAEVESMIYLAQKLNYIDNNQEDKLHQQTTEVGRLLSGFIKKLSAKDY